MDIKTCAGSKNPLVMPGEIEFYSTTKKQ